MTYHHNTKIAKVIAANVPSHFHSGILPRFTIKKVVERRKGFFIATDDYTYKAADQGWPDLYSFSSISL